MHAEIGDRLNHQLAFLNAVEQLKLIYRHNKTVDQSRFENSAEHSWHVALMAVVFSEHANAEGIDLLKVIKMLLIHDVVEIYAGDTWIYDEQATQEQAHKEAVSAAKVFGLLPSDQADAFQLLWNEFEARHTPEAAFAAAVDSLQPLTNHVLSGTPDAVEPRLTQSNVLNRKHHIAVGSSVLWELAQLVITESVNKGLYRAESVST